jgi:hypothetical protein
MTQGSVKAVHNCEDGTQVILSCDYDMTVDDEFDRMLAAMSGNLRKRRLDDKDAIADLWSDCKAEHDGVYLTIEFVGTDLIDTEYSASDWFKYIGLFNLVENPNFYNATAGEKEPKDADPTVGK